MSRETRYKHHILNVFLTEKAIAEEVAAEAGIDIEFKKPRWYGPAEAVEDMVGVYCETAGQAARFRRAFSRRRWEDSKGPGGE